MRKYSLSALAVAGLLVGGFSAGSASAADLGGNCCADLEERIAELEATTARKGNRKVSLTISGWVAEQVMWWDDGEESNVYVGGIGTTLASHFKMTGSAQISPGWSAGYVIHVETVSTEPYGPAGWNQINSDNSGSFLNMLQSFWFIKSDHLGKVSIGKQSQASDNTAILPDGSGSLVPANWVLFDNSNFFLTASGEQGGELTAGGATWGDIAFCNHTSLGIGGDCNGITENVVRYDSPTWGGFSVSASWGEDDLWDVAARYAGEWGGFKVAAAAAYSHNTDEFLLSLPTTASATTPFKRDSGFYQVGAYVEHVPTGLWAYGAYGREDNDQVTANFTFTPQAGFFDPFGFFAAAPGAVAVQADDGDVWYVKAGLRERWHPLGHTVLFGLYSERNDMFNGQVFGGVESECIIGCFFGLQEHSYTQINSSRMTEWGAGIVQEFDPAAMSMWLVWKHFEGKVSGVEFESVCALGACSDFAEDGTFTQKFNDFDLVKFGALINF